MMRVGGTDMAIAACRDTFPTPRHTGVAYGIPDPRMTATEPPHPAERVIEGEVIDRTRWRGTLTTRDYLELRGLATSDASDIRDRSRIKAWLRAEPDKDNASSGVLDIYV